LEGKTVVGVQLQSDEVYRDYPAMEILVREISREQHVLVFDGETINGYEGQNITKVAGMPMRRAFALASGCSAIIAPDSAFVHLAAALDIPCVGLFGPVDGKVRTKHYPKCKFLDARRDLGCLPCWRNEQIPCKLTNMRTSVCIADISISEIQRALNEVLTWR
jgi:ADP-heptose:LPS heptosyltransferase